MNTDGPRCRRSTACRLLPATLGLLLANCSLPPAQPDPTRFFVLSATTTAAAPAKGPAVFLRAVELASYLNGRPMIVRRGDNEIEFRDYARWGEPLELGIGRVLREELLARGAAGAVVANASRAAGGERDFALAVRVLACEGGTDGAVHFRAVWELATAGDAAKVAARGEFRAADLRWDGKNESTLAGKLSEAVAALSAEIAAALARPAG